MTTRIVPDEEEDRRAVEKLRELFENNPFKIESTKSLQNGVTDNDSTDAEENGEASGGTTLVMVEKMKKKADTSPESDTSPKMSKPAGLSQEVKDKIIERHTNKYSKCTQTETLPLVFPDGAMRDEGITEMIRDSDNQLIEMGTRSIWSQIYTTIKQNQPEETYRIFDTLMPLNKPRIMDHIDITGQTLLSTAVTYQREWAFKWLVREGADLGNSSSQWGWDTVFHFTAINNPEWLRYELQAARECRVTDEKLGQVLAQRNFYSRTCEEILVMQCNHLAAKQPQSVADSHKIQAILEIKRDVHQLIARFL